MEDKRFPLKVDDKRHQQIEVRFKNSVCQKRKVKTWTPQQDELLFQLHEKFPKKWNKISEMMGNRNENQCLHRFRRLVQVGEHKKIWSPSQDQIVLQMVQKYGNNWKVIATTIKTKTGKQIRQRYINKLDPSIKRQEWSQAEDLKVIDLYTRFGSKWSQISKQLSGRPQNRIKNRFYSYIQRNYDILIKDEGTNTQELTPQQSQEIKSCMHEQAKKYSNFLYFPQKKSNLHFPSSEVQNKQNKQVQHCQKIQKIHEGHDRIVSRKSIEQEWNRQRSLQQINEPNEIAYVVASRHNEDFFYFQDN